MSQANSFPDVTLLITVYNRSRSLERLLSAFAHLGCHFGDIVVSDDCSKPEHLAAIHEVCQKFGCRLITTPQNKGLGHNLNKGQDAVKTPYTLYVQEDFVPRDVFPDCLREALNHMGQRADLDLVRFYSYFKYPCLKPIAKGVSEMQFRPTYLGYRKFYMYSDHPHLRRTNFFEKFGRYTEGIRIDKTEYRMMMSFLQNKGKALYYEDYRGIFDQLNSEDEPSTIARASWRLTDNPLISAARHIYRHVRFRYDYLFLRAKSPSL